MPPPFSGVPRVGTVHGMPTVLVVDDFPPFRAVARMMLAASGWDVVAEAGSGEDAIAAAADTRPDVVVMDVCLPGIDGMEATRRIVAGLPATVVVLVSSRREEDLPADVVACGASGFLPKEAFSPDAIASLRGGGQHPLAPPG